MPVRRADVTTFLTEGTWEEEITKERKLSSFALSGG